MGQQNGPERVHLVATLARCDEVHRGKAREGSDEDESPNKQDRDRGRQPGLLLSSGAWASEALPSRVEHGSLRWPPRAHFSLYACFMADFFTDEVLQIAGPHLRSYVEIVYPDASGLTAIRA